MSGEPPFDPELEEEPSDAELQAANALREALDGRRPGTHLPEAALETAALLRFSAAHSAGVPRTPLGQFAAERSAAVRADLLASLGPASGRARKRRDWRYWLGISLTFAGGATAVVVIGVIGARQLSTPSAREEASFSDTRSSAATSASASEVTPEATPGAAPADSLAAAAPAETEKPAAEAEQRFAASEGAPVFVGEEAARGSGARARPARAKSEALRLDQREDQDDRSLRRMANASAADKEAAASGALAGNGTSRSAGTAGGGMAIGHAPVASAFAGSPPAGSPPAASAPAASAGPAEQPAPGVAKADESAAEAKKGAPMPPTEQVERESRKYRAQVLSELRDPRVDGAYAELDRAQSKPDLERAQARLRALESGFGGADAPPNAARIRPDLYCRLAEVALRLGQPKTALDWVQRGLDLGAAPSPFVARLYLLQGQARSALGDREGAAKSYMKAIEINEQLLDDSLDGRQ